jgi:hypothetical protein
MLIKTNVPELYMLQLECEHVIQPLSYMLGWLVAQHEARVETIDDRSYFIVDADNIKITIPFIPEVAGLVRFTPFAYHIEGDDMVAGAVLAPHVVKRQRLELLPPMDEVLETPWTAGDRHHGNLTVTGDFINGYMREYSEQFACVMEESVDVSVMDTELFFRETMLKQPFLALVDIDEIKRLTKNPGHLR